MVEISHLDFRITSFFNVHNTYFRNGVTQLMFIITLLLRRKFKLRITRQNRIHSMVGLLVRPHHRKSSVDAPILSDVVCGPAVTMNSTRSKISEVTKVEVEFVICVLVCFQEYCSIGNILAAFAV